MAIVTHPHPALRRVAKPFADVGGPSKRLANDLRAHLRPTTGIGLAAPQIGRSMRMILLSSREDMIACGGLVMINPVIVAMSDDVSDMAEGCLSIPGRLCVVTRPSMVTVSFISEAGDEKTLELEGLSARCVQHEVDHLDGVLIIDRVKRTSFDVHPPSPPSLRSLPT